MAEILVKRSQITVGISIEILSASMGRIADMWKDVVTVIQVHMVLFLVLKLKTRQVGKNHTNPTKGFQQDIKLCFCLFTNFS